MNTAPIPTASEFQHHIREKIQNFSHRPFIFTQINHFLTRQPRGYFTLIGAPGTGKSAILAKYAAENPHVIYYSAELCVAAILGKLVLNLYKLWRLVPIFIASKDYLLKCAKLRRNWD